MVTRMVREVTRTVKIVARMVTIVTRMVRGITRIVKIVTRIIKYYQDGHNGDYDSPDSQKNCQDCLYDGKQVYEVIVIDLVDHEDQLAKVKNINGLDITWLINR